MEPTATALVFNNENFGNITVYGTPEQPLFVAREVCQMLGISAHRDALAKLEDFEKGHRVIIDTPGGPQGMATLTEAGLYSLILRSKKPNAVPFRKWVVTEVLPAIRRTGQYAASGSAERQQSLVELLAKGLQAITALLRQNQTLMRQVMACQVSEPKKPRTRQSLHAQRNQLIIEEFRALRHDGYNCTHACAIIGARYGLVPGSIKMIIARSGYNFSDFGPDVPAESGVEGIAGDSTDNSTDNTYDNGTEV